MMRLLGRLGLALVLASCGAHGTTGVPAALPPPANTAPGAPSSVNGYPVTITEFPLPDASDSGGGLTVGSDGAVWFGSLRHINRTDAFGHITMYDTPRISGYYVAGPVTGADGSIWFAGLIQSDAAAVSQYCIGQPSCSQPMRLSNGRFTIVPIPPPLPSNFIYSMARGPGGSIWVIYTELFSYQYRLAALNADGTLKFEKLLVQGVPFGGSTQPQAMILGPDGAMYVSVASPGEHYEIWRFDSLGNITARFTAGVFARSMAVGSDGALWMVPYTGGFNTIERFKLNGSYRDFVLPQQTASLEGITAGSDGALWFTDLFNNDIGRITTAGSITLFPLPSGCVGSGPVGIVSCPGACENAHVRLWFTQGHILGRLVY